jgi:hypothetical protein
VNVDDELRDLVERAYQIRELQQSDGWALLRDYVATQVNAKNRHLLNGHARTIEDYRAEAGWIQGAMFVLEAADRLDEQLAAMRARVDEEKAAAKETG